MEGSATILILLSGPNGLQAIRCHIRFHAVLAADPAVASRILDQLLYKWAHTRQVVAGVMVEKFGLQFAAGWRPTEEEIRRDVRAIFGGTFAEFLAK